MGFKERHKAWRTSHVQNAARAQPISRAYPAPAHLTTIVARNTKGRTATPLFPVGFQAGGVGDLIGGGEMARNKKAVRCSARHRPSFFIP